VVQDKVGRRLAEPELAPEYGETLVQLERLADPFFHHDRSSPAVYPWHRVCEWDAGTLTPRSRRPHQGP
jgi:hypothetical protein